MFRHRIIVTTALMCAMLTVAAQTRKIQHKPYIDLRPMHFGILVGLNLQDIEFENVGPQTITLDDGTTKQETLVCEADRWNAERRAAEREKGIVRKPRKNEPII